MQMKKTDRQNAHYVCGGCGKPFETLLKLYGHEKTCKGRRASVPPTESIENRAPLVESFPSHSLRAV